MNLLDFILLTPLVIGLARGLYKGLINELASLVSLLGGALMAYLFADEVYSIISNYVDEPGLGTQVLSYAIVFVAVVIGVYIIAKALTKMMKLVALGFLNRIVGGIFGLAKALILLLISIYFLQSFIKSQRDSKQELVAQSLLLPYFEEYSDLVGYYINVATDEANKTSLPDNLNINSTP